MTKDEAQRVVNAVLANLEGRSGFDILNLIHDDTDVYEEMYANLTASVQKAAACDDDPKESMWHPDE